MKISDIAYSKDKRRACFVISDTTPGYVNALRRSISTLVPTLAIEDVEVQENTSALYDEVIAHRLGLLPLTTDLKSYKLPSEFPDDGELRAECYVKMTLEAQGPGTVYADQLVSKDPAVKCAFPKMPIVKLLENHSIKLEATAVLGQGTEHMKWAAGTAYFQKLPTVESKGKKHIISPKDIIDQKSQEVFVKEDGSVNLANVKDKDATIAYSETDYLFTVASWGQLPVKDMVVEAINQLDKQLDEVATLVK